MVCLVVSWEWLEASRTSEELGVRSEELGNRQPGSVLKRRKLFHVKRVGMPHSFYYPLPTFH